MSKAMQGERWGEGGRPPGPVGWAEVLGVLLLWMGIAAVPLRDTLFDSEARLAGFDTVTAQMPWSAGGGAAPRNPALADVGTYFQPMRRHGLDAWSRGEVPLWNRGIYMGVPHLANPQSGALDPQVVIPGLLADRWLPGGYERIAAYVAWFRIALGGLGAWLLARALGLGRGGAFLTSISFGGSGFGWLWLQHSLGHAAPFLPWIFLGLLRGARGRTLGSHVSGNGRGEGGDLGSDSRGVLPGLLLAGFAWCGAILAGHPETAAGLGIASSAFALALARHHRGSGPRLLLALGLGTGLAAAQWVPFTEYLLHSGAWFLRNAQIRPALDLDLLTLGAGLIVLGAWWRSRAEGSAAWEGTRGPFVGLAFGLGVAGVAALALGGEGVGQELRLLAWPSSFGPPGRGWFGAETQPEAAIAWVAAPVLAFAAVSFVRRPALGRDARSIDAGTRRGPERWLAHRGFLGGMGLVALLLSLRLPAVEGLRQALAGLALSEPGRWAPVAALGLGLRAGEAFEGAGVMDRRGGAALLLGVLGLSAAGGGFLRAPMRPAPERAPEVPAGFVGFSALPELRPDLRFESNSSASFAGWIHGDLGLGGARAVLRGHGRDRQGSPERRWSVPLRLSTEPFPFPGEGDGEGNGEGDRAEALGSERALEPAPPGAVHFRADHLDLRRLGEGRWLLELELLPRPGLPGLARGGLDEPVDGGGIRRVHALEFEIRRPRDLAAFDLFAWLLTLAWLFSTPTSLARFGIPALALLQVWRFAEDLHPAVPRSEFYPRTEVLSFLQEHRDGARVLASPGVFPANSNLLYGIPSADGYDGLDVASFNHYRPWAMGPGAQGLLDWHGDAMDLDAPAFWMLRVGWLLGTKPIEHPNWELVLAPPDAELFVHRARRSLPRAVVVTELRGRDEVLANPREFDPWNEAFLAEGDPWQLRDPATEGSVEVVEVSSHRSEFEVRCDGDALLVVFDQDFPGWRAEVDGSATDVRTVNAIFQGVALGAGKHRVVLEYRPRSWPIGLGVSALCALAWIVAALRLRRRPS